MRRNLIIAGLIFALGVLAGSQLIATASPDFLLRGDRFRPLTYAELNPAQKAYADREIATGRKSFDGPTNIYLRSPEMATLSRPAASSGPTPDRGTANWCRCPTGRCRTARSTSPMR